MRPRIPNSRRNAKSWQSSRQSSQQHANVHEQAADVSGGVGGSNGDCPPNLRRPIPVISHDGPLVFEAFAFAYCMISLLLQYLHLYKSVWWLPHSYNSYAMNFYLIDVQLIAFCTVVLVRRLVWNLQKKIITAVTPANWTNSFIVVLRSLNTFATLIALLYLAYRIVQSHPVTNMLYLMYPVTLYFLLFGLAGEPFLELTPPSPSGKIKIVCHKAGVYLTTGPSSAPFFQLVNPASSSSPPPAAAAAAAGSVQPDLIRQEVSTLKSDFNMRLKQVMFNTVLSAYYGAVIPCFFVQSTLYYDLAWVGRHALLVGVGAFVVYVVQCFPSSYVLMMNRTALLLGQWNKGDNKVVANLYSQWNSSVMWPAGSNVRHGKDVYKAEGETNCAEPGNLSHARFYALFKEPSLFLSILLMVQSGLVMAQHISLTWSSQWYQLLSEALMLFSNYYALFKVLRDYIVFWRFFCTEEEMKASSPSTAATADGD